MLITCKNQRTLWKTHLKVLQRLMSLLFPVTQGGRVVYETRYDSSNGSGLQRIQETKTPVSARSQNHGETGEAAEDWTGAQEKTEASGNLLYQSFERVIEADWTCALSRRRCRSSSRLWACGSELVVGYRLWVKPQSHGIVSCHQTLSCLMQTLL